jgi:hypothetical protein
MTSYVLYDNPLAFHPGKARLALVEKAVPFTTKVINLFNGDSLKPEYLRVRRPIALAAGSLHLRQAHLPNRHTDFHQ